MARESNVSSDELKWLRRIAGVARKMTSGVDFERVEQHAKDWPGTSGPSLKTTAGRTRDLMTALHMLDLATRKDATHD